MPDEQLTIDFGTDELNDPNYEENVDKQEALDGAGDDDSVSTQEPQGGGEQDAPQDQQVQDRQSGDGSQPQVGASGAQQQPAQQQDGRTRSDKDGNLVDGRGNIIAKAGAERRQYERTQAQAAHISRLEAENKQLRDNDSMVKALNEVPARLGLDMRETELGLQAIASFKKDPVATAKWMLQETLKLGYNLGDVLGKDAQGQVSGGSLDLQAIKGMIAEQVAPLVQDRQAALQQTELQEAAQRDYDAFMAKHDHASVHEDVLTRLLQQDASLTPEIAYWQLREYAAKHGFDFTKPLREQAVSRESGQQQQPNGNATPKAQSQQPMPNGGAPQADMQTAGVYADADEAWDSIVNQSLREAGFLQ